MCRGRLGSTPPSPHPGTVPFQEIVPMSAKRSLAPSSGVSSPSAQEEFLRILPRVQRHAQCYFRHLGAEAQEEAVAQATALAFAAFRRLQEQGKDPFAFPSQLAT